MQIAHIINQLVEYSQHLDRLIDHSKETLQNLWDLMKAALGFADDQASFVVDGGRTQYRFHFD